MDMGAGNIIGGAFTAIVKSMVSDILNPILGIFLGSVNFSSLAVSVGDAVFSYGNFIMGLINFLLIVSVLFILVR
jgi:large conductance mechanosensitive channel